MQIYTRIFSCASLSIENFKNLTLKVKQNKAQNNTTTYLSDNYKTQIFYQKKLYSLKLFNPKRQKAQTHPKTINTQEITLLKTQY